jgi:hypothetical protein
MKNIKNKIKKILKVLLSIVVLLVLGASFFIYSSQHIMFWDYPKNLSSEKETIEVTYVRWACACANWLPTEFADADIETQETECIFIEAANKDLIVSDSIIDKYSRTIKLRLTGSFYNDKGISRTYESPTSQIPDNARVFRYTTMEILNK